MSRKLFLIIGLLAVGTLLIARIAARPKSFPANIAIITVTQLREVDGQNAFAVLVISNRTEIPLIFRLNGTYPLLTSSFEIGGVWTIKPELKFGTYGYHILAGHKSFETKIEVPPDVKKAKFGLYVTPLSPITQAFLNLQSVWACAPVRTLTHWFSSRDDRYSTEVWSEVINLKSQ